MEIKLTGSEAALLREVLEQSQRELLREIARSSHHEFRRVLREKENHLSALLDKINVAREEELALAVSE